MTEARKPPRCETAGQRYCNVKSKARRRGLSFDISPEQYTVLIALPCYYCFGPLSRAGGSLDRLDNSLGYALGNVVPCCGRCNAIRSDKATPGEARLMLGFISLIKGVRAE
jgi:hypothetical protein